MSYSNKIGIYQGDCEVLLGKYKKFSYYINSFSQNVKGHGLDLGAGPGGCNFRFFKHCLLDGCDVEEEVVNSLTTYPHSFQYKLGSDEKLPYDNNLDFIVCSCVIQHLNSSSELEKGIQEIFRSLKKDGLFYLMFKSGTNDTLFTHFNDYYKEERSFRVFHPTNITNLCNNIGFKLKEKEILLDDNWIPYTLLIFIK